MRASYSAHPPLCVLFAPLRSYANRCCAARQAEQLQRPGDADYNGQTHIDPARTEAFAIYVIFVSRRFAVYLSTRLYCTPACGSIFLSVDLKWLLVAVSSQWLLWGLPSCGLSVVAELVAWSSPEEAPLCWMDVSEAALDSEYWWRRC